MAAVSQGGRGTAGGGTAGGGWRIDPAALARRVRARRLASSQSVREAAAEVGISAATLSRVERGDYSPGRENLLKLVEWLGISVDDLTPAAALSRHHGEPEDTPEAVALHLRADQNLDPGDAEMLEQLFRQAYETLRRRKQSPGEARQARHGTARHGTAGQARPGEMDT